MNNRLKTLKMNMKNTEDSKKDFKGIISFVFTIFLACSFSSCENILESRIDYLSTLKGNTDDYTSECSVLYEKDSLTINLTNTHQGKSHKKNLSYFFDQTGYYTGVQNSQGNEVYTLVLSVRDTSYTLEGPAGNRYVFSIDKVGNDKFRSVFKVDGIMEYDFIIFYNRVYDISEIQIRNRVRSFVYKSRKY